MNTVRRQHDSGMARRCVEDAVLFACIAEVGALKPGNVSVYGAGHGMRVDDFVVSASAASAALSRPAERVGERILRAIQATRNVVRMNTNLGIVLLCAPLVHAVFHATSRVSLRAALADVLATLDDTDACLAYRAIRLAEPGGMGSVGDHDLSEAEPQVSLLEAMRAAQGRDRIAYQYAHGFRDIFDDLLPRYHTALAHWGRQEWAIAATYIDTLSSIPDSHIVRRHGHDVARAVCRRARCVGLELSRHHTGEASTNALLEFDAELKRRGVNPGTTADLIVATLTLWRLEKTLPASTVLFDHGEGNGSGCYSSTVLSRSNLQ